MMIVPEVVPQLVVSLYPVAIWVGVITGLIGLLGIAFQKNDLSVLILTDLVGVAMLIIVAGVATDLAEALILPGLVVELAEIMAISEILLSREMRKSGKSKKDLAPSALPLNMEILKTAPIFIAVILIAYGVFLSGFTGGAVAGGGILFYVLSKNARGLPVELFDGVAGVSGIAWVFWIVGFLLFFVGPSFWLLGLMLSAFGLLIKVASKVGLIGMLTREEFKKE
ncbi:MAG: EhaG family protein [Methanobacteriaceae archaeon]|nr:EhaG family protein [Methanobacteriaceae archaeon]